MTLIGSAGSGSYEEFMTEYDPSHANDIDSTRRTTLMAGLGNTKPEARIAISNKLLDDGADPTATKPDGVNCLHILLGAVRHDFTLEARLLHRLIDGGADINAVAKKFGTPLQTLMDNFAFTDDDYQPFYDVIFQQDNLDLLKIGAFKDSTLTSARKAVKLRAGLLARMETYLREHNTDIPAEN